jgi:hypothetical protein
MHDRQSSREKRWRSRRAIGRASLLLGWSLATQLRFSKEALLALRAAAREYPEAHLAAR